MSALEDILRRMNGDLISDIRKFLSETGMGPSYFGKAACGNSEVVGRLESGRTITLETAERIRAFMAERRTRPAPAEAAE
jgi:hypothetical protein